MNNPIIQRELISMLRTRKSFAVQVCLVLALTMLVMVRWPTESRVNISGAEAQEVLRVFGYGLMVGIILIVPIFPATTIVREKQSGTLALLLNSPLRPLDIMIGKLAGVIGFVAVLLALSLPPAAACYSMGGVDLWQELIPLYAVLALIAVQYAFVGLLVSCYANSVDGALKMTYGAILVLAVLSLGPFAFLRGTPGMPQQALEWIRALSPLPAVMKPLGQEAVGAGGVTPLVDPIFAYTAWSVIIIVICAAVILWRLGQRLLDRPRPAGTVTDEQDIGTQFKRRIMYLWFFDPRRRSSMIGPLSNPVTVKEFRVRRLGRSHWFMRLIAACLIISLGGMYVISTFGTTALAKSHDVNKPIALGAVLVTLQMALIVLVTPALASGLISGERESRGWQLLQNTPLSSVRIVSGKLWSVLLTMLLLLLATLPGYVVLTAMDLKGELPIPTVLMLTAYTTLFAVLVGGAVSSLFEKTAPATATTYGVLLALCVGTMLAWLGENAPFTRSTVEAVLLLNPFAVALHVIRVPGFEQYDLLPGHWYVLGGGCVLSLMILTVQTYRLTRPQ